MSIAPERIKLTAISNGKVFDVTGWTSTAAISEMATGLHSTNFVDIIPCTKKDITNGTVENFLVLLDSTLVGSYYYKPQNGSLKLVGKLSNNNSFNFVERDINENITGFFDGR
jgi:hypothetical protein